MQITHANLSALNTAVQTTFNERLTGTETSWNKIAMEVKSSTSAQTYPKLSQMGGMTKWIGDRVIQRLGIDTFEVVNDTFSNAIAIGVDEISDDQHGVYTPVIADFGRTAAELPDELVWQRLELGFTTSHYDGQFFFDADHPVTDEFGVERSVSNITTGSGKFWYLVDDTRMIKPLIFQNRLAAQITAQTSLTDDNVFSQNEFVWGAKRRCAAGFGAWDLIHASSEPLTPASYEAARAKMGARFGDMGRKLNLRPQLLVVGSSNEGAARRILKNEYAANGGTNEWQGTAELHVENRLTA